MKIIELPTLVANLDRPAVIEAVRHSLIDHVNGTVQSPMAMHLLFEEDGAFVGDCHVKAAQGDEREHFVVKIASGFYGIAGDGLNGNSGIALLFSSRTGQPVTLFRDDGWLTAWRTAAAGALSVEIAAPSPGEPLGILGTGTQARLQAEWIARHCNIGQVIVWGRDAGKAAALVDDLERAGIEAFAVATVSELGKACRIIVTTTPAAHTVLSQDNLGRRAHIVAVGSDNAGKREIDGAIFSRASAIVVDDCRQCLAHGEFGAAHRDGIVAADAFMLLGGILAREDTLDGDLNVVDLTGLGAQDLAIATVFHKALAG